MRTLHYLDIWLVVYVYERFSWYTDYYYRISCFMLAMFCLSAYIAVMTFHLVPEFGYLLAAFAATVSFFAFGMIAKEHIRTVRRKPGEVNYWKRIWWLRPLTVLVAILVARNQFASQGFSWTELVSELLFISAFFFLSCNPLPEEVRKARAALEASQK